MSAISLRASLRAPAAGAQGPNSPSCLGGVAAVGPGAGAGGRGDGSGAGEERGGPVAVERADGCAAGFEGRAEEFVVGAPLARRKGLPATWPASRSSVGAAVGPVAA